VTKRSKKVKCTSALLVIAGSIGSAMSLWKYFNAGNIAHKIVSRGSDESANPEGFMARDEFILYDTFKTVNMLKFIISLMILWLG